MKKQTVGLISQIYKESKIKLLYSLVLILIFSNCQKECNTENVYYNVGNVDKAMLPYTGYDTITFVRTSFGDTNVFIGKGKSINYETTQVSTDCGNRNNFENYSYKYASSSANDLLFIGQYVSTNFNQITLSFVELQNERIDDILFLNSSNLDSTLVLNKLYKNVQMIKNSNGSKVYLNKEFGCLKIILNNGEIWELLTLKN